MKLQHRIVERSFAVVTVGCLAAVTCADNPVQWRLEDGGNGHWYGVIGTYSSSGLGLSWDEAREQALSLGGDLASITSAAENDFIFQTLAGDPTLWHTDCGSYCFAWGPWIGLSAVNDSWAWCDGSPLSYLAWAPGEPFEGAQGAVQYYNWNQASGQPLPSQHWDNAGAYRGMFAIVEWSASVGPPVASVVCWGRNDDEQCQVPTDLGQCLSIDGGNWHTVALTAQHTVTCWGRNDIGQCDVPSALGACLQVSAGAAHTMALTVDGSVACWGYNAWGQCNVPANLGPCTQICAGIGDHCVALKSDGGVVCWGRNMDGQCNVPAALGPVAQVSAGWSHTLALRADGSVVAWGLNDYAQSTVPATLGPCTLVEAGTWHSVAIKADGTVVCWGLNDFGQCNVPVGLGPCTSVAAGNRHTVALRVDGTVVCWGNNDYGQCDIPDQLGPCARVGAGGSHTLAERLFGPSVLVPTHFPTIQAAVNAASTGWVIRVLPGTHAGFTFNGKAVTVESTSGPQQTILSGAMTPGSIVKATMGEGPGSILRGFTLSGGSPGTPHPDAPTALVGAGLFAYLASPTIENCIFTNNTSAFGGGAYLLHSTAEFAACKFQGNVAGVDGGGVQAFGGAVTLLQCDFESNASVTYGGHLHLVGGSPTLSGVTLRSGSSYYGGGLSWFPLSSQSSLSIADSLITGNAASGFGGGIWVRAGQWPPVSLTDTTVCTNDAQTTPVNIYGAWLAVTGNTVCDCIGDVNGDATVNGLDLSLLLGHWGACSTGFCLQDVNFDGVVNGLDLATLLGHWGACP